MARKIAIPEEIENKCRQYCKDRKFKEGTFLRLLILNKENRGADTYRD